MARFIGIDITPSYVRAALLRAGYRTLNVERLLEVERHRVETLEQALQTCVLPLLEHGEAMAVAIDGEESFIHRLTLPGSAQKQLAQVLPFELEAHVPVDMDELTHAYRLLPSQPGSKDLLVLAAAARTARVRDRIALVARALGREPERIGCGPLPLANLAALTPELAVPGPIALVDVGEHRTETVVLENGHLVAARTVARGMAGLPEGADALAAEIRQTFGAWAATGGAPVTRVCLLGLGASDYHAPAYLAHTLGVPVQALSGQGFSELAPENEPLLPRFAQAMGLAAGLKQGRDLDLRQGSMAFERGHEFVKEKAPLLTGLVGAIVVSFLFATWAELSGLSREHEVLATTLATLSRDVLGEETEDPERATELLETGGERAVSDPMPHADAFDMLIGLSETIPMTMTHDIDEFDMQRGKVKLRGIVDTAADAKKVAKDIEKIRCVKNVKTGKITQVVNSDRQKYSLEFDVRCLEDQGKSKAKKAKAEEKETGE